MVGSTALKWVERNGIMKPSFDSVAALMRELSSSEQQVLTDSDNRPKIKQFLSGLQPSLTLVGVIEVRPSTNFVASGFFKVNTDKSSPLKISHVGDSFKAWFFKPSANERVAFCAGPYRMPGVQSSTTIKIMLRYQVLNKRLVDESLINQLGGEAKAEITLAEIAACMQNQASGDHGALLTNGYSNIFYVRDVNDVLRAVRVDWADGGWGVRAFSLEGSGGWNQDRQVFSRNS